MKKLFLFVLFLGFLSFSSKGQIFDTTFYSASLNKDATLSIYLPPDYSENSTYYYPVIYYLHGWNGDENSANSAMLLADSLIINNIIDPVIIICPNNNSDPFKGSFYINSITNGDYETYSIVDVLNFVEGNYRAFPHKNYRALMGQSMGGYGSFRLGILHKELFRGIAAHGSPLNFNLIIANAISEITSENQGPPYFYDYDVTGIFTKMIFAMSAAFTPNLYSTQTYISPTIVDFPVDDQGDLIDTIYQKWKSFDPVSFVNTLLPSDSLAILFGDGVQDNLHLYPANIAFKDTLSSLGIEFEFYDHPYFHAMPFGFRDRGLKFLDSIMPPPSEISCNDPSNFQVTNITQTSAEFSWSEEWNSSNWNIYFDTVGFDTIGIAPTLIYSKPYQITGLYPNGYYDFYVQSLCSVGGESSWVGPFELKTFCDPMSSNYSEDFEGSSLIPECWFQLTSDASVLATIADSLSLSGNNSAVLYAGEMASGFHGLATPELDELSSVPIEIRFAARTFLGSSLLYIGTLENPLDLNSWKVYDSIVVVDEYQDYAIKIDTIGIENNRFVAFRHSLDTTHIFIDDFSYATSDKKIDGYFNYYNKPKTPLEGLTLNLKNGSTQVETTTTDANGYFEFVDIPNSTYTIDVSTTIETGGINSLDAGKANLWWTSPSAIERVKWYAGEVDSSGSINATDAGMIQQHFVFGAPFTRGEWAFWKQNDVSSSNNPTSINNIVVNDENISQTFYGICVGDFKGDFIPSLTPRISASDLMLITKGSIISGHEMEFELPIKVNSSMQLAALSLIIEIPSSKVTVKEVYLNKDDFSKTPIDFNVTEDELKIGWNAPQSIEYHAGSTLLTLTLKTTNDFKAGDEFQLEIIDDSRNQLADSEYEAIENVVLNAPAVAFSPTGLSEEEFENSSMIEIYPNPFQLFTFINYSVPEDGKVILEVYNINGELVKSLVNKIQKQGRYSIKYRPNNNEPGIYSVILRVKSNGKFISRFAKIINNSK